MYSKTSRIVIISFAILVVGFFIFKTYSKLGGSQPLNISIEEPNSYLIYGKEYVGKYNSREMKDLFYQVREVALSDSVNGVFCIVSNLDFEIEDNKTVSYFVGALVDRQLDFPGDLIEKKIEFNSALSIDLSMHNAVMPLPEEVDQAMTEFAEGKNISLENFTIEKYINEDLLVIERPISRD